MKVSSHYYNILAWNKLYRKASILNVSSTVTIIIHIGHLGVAEFKRFGKIILQLIAQKIGTLLIET